MWEIHRWPVITQRASNAESVPIWWRHHVFFLRTNLSRGFRSTTNLSLIRMCNVMLEEILPCNEHGFSHNKARLYVRESHHLVRRRYCEFGRSKLSLPDDVQRSSLWVESRNWFPPFRRFLRFSTTLFCRNVRYDFSQDSHKRHPIDPLRRRDTGYLFWIITSLHSISHQVGSWYNEAGIINIHATYWIIPLICGDTGNGNVIWRIW